MRVDEVDEDKMGRAAGLCLRDPERVECQFSQHVLAIKSSASTGAPKCHSMCVRMWRTSRPSSKDLASTAFMPVHRYANRFANLAYSSCGILRAEPLPGICPFPIN